MSLANNISKLRMKYNISQEQFAEKISVSRQAVQKWENGTSTPDLSNIITIAKKFGVSVDALLLDRDSRIMEELKGDKLIQPCFEKMSIWNTYSKQLYVEYLQCVSEGKDIEDYSVLFDEVIKLPDGPQKDKIAEGVFELCMAAPIKEDFKFTEPSDLKGITELTSNISYDLKRPKKSEFESKVKGAWYGRIAGCLLGKPVEGIRTNELIPFLKDTKNYPMYRYITKADITEEITQKYSFPFADKTYTYIDCIDAAPSDDDTNYTVLGQVIINNYGRDFTPEDVAAAWLNLQPQTAYCTAERVAYNNFINGYIPPVSAVYKNPCREYIGAQIRADYFGYINPADPVTAADMAWRDASISHIKNGIYGEMFVAAMLAAAASEDNFEKIIEIGLNCIPSTSRLYESVSRVLNWYREGIKKEEVFKRIHNEWDEHSGFAWCHTISNAMIVTAALLYGENFSQSICLAVQTGFDTDCNGATVGSVYGMAKGISSIPNEWIAPLKGKLNTDIRRHNLEDIDNLVQRTLEHAGY